MTAAWQALGDVAAEVTARLRRERLARRLHRLGARPCFEAMLEIEAGEPLDDVLERYAQLEPEIVAALGGDQFPAAPIHEVSS